VNAILESSQYKDFEDRLEYVHRLLKQVQTKKLEELRREREAGERVPTTDDEAYDLAMKRTADAVAAVSQQPQILRARL